MKKEKNILSDRVPDVIVSGVVIPFVLFWIGALAIIFFDRFWMILPSFIPFYGYMVFIDGRLWKDDFYDSVKMMEHGEKVSKMLGFSYLMAFVTSIILMILFESVAFGVNVSTSFAMLLVSSVLDVSRYNSGRIC